MWTGRLRPALLRLKKKSLLGFFSELILLSEWKEPRSDRRRQAQGKEPRKYSGQELKYVECVAEAHAMQ